MANKARKWFSESEHLPEIKVLRCLHLGQDEELLSLTLQTFLDASQDAYGAVVYSRTHYEGPGVKKDSCCKNKSCATFHDNYPQTGTDGSCSWVEDDRINFQMLNSALNQATFWSDSMNVLWWVRERSWSFKLFAANRVGEIQSLKLIRTDQEKAS